MALDDSERSIKGKLIEVHYITLFHLQSAHNFTCCGSEWIQSRYLHCITAWKHVSPRSITVTYFAFQFFFRNKNNVPNKKTSFRYSKKLITSYQISTCVKGMELIKLGGGYNGLRKSGGICGENSTIGW